MNAPVFRAKYSASQCDPQTGLHERIDLDRNGMADLLLLGDTYKRWYVPRHIVEDWARWIHQEFNNGSHDVLEGKYSLELILEWSPTRITIVVLFPVLLSLAVGLWLNAQDWTDLATIQTAWGTASYIVTAGGRMFPIDQPLKPLKLTIFSICGVAGCSKQHTWIVHHCNTYSPLLLRG